MDYKDKSIYLQAVADSGLNANLTLEAHLMIAFCEHYEALVEKGEVPDREWLFGFLKEKGIEIE